MVIYSTCFDLAGITYIGLISVIIVQKELFDLAKDKLKNRKRVTSVQLSSSVMSRSPTSASRDDMYVELLCFGPLYQLHVVVALPVL